MKYKKGTYLSFKTFIKLSIFIQIFLEFFFLLITKKYLYF